MVNVTEVERVEISEEWSAEREVRIEDIRSNTTNVTLESPVWTGRWAYLVVRGNLVGEGGEEGMEGRGGTVAEWSLVPET